jgi:hypothetical protein
MFILQADGSYGFLSFYYGLSMVLLKYQYMYEGPNSPPFIFSKLMNGPNMLECYITIGWKGLSVTNTLAYWVQSSVAKKIYSCETSSYLYLYIIYLYVYVCACV